MINFVENAFAVQIDCPIMSKRVALRLLLCLVAMSPRPIAAGVVAEQWFHDPLQMCFDNLLCNTIKNGWNTGFPSPSAFLVDIGFCYGLWKVTAGC